MMTLESVPKLATKLSRIQRPSRCAGLLTAIAGLVAAACLAVDEPPIDPVRGRALMEKSSRGEPLNAEEQVYLGRVKKAIRERAAGRQPNVAMKGKAVRTAAVNTNDWSALIPITDLTVPYKGDPQLNYDPTRGEVKTPLALWGPYIWACGNSPRKLDGLTWTQNDVRPDQLHPNENGCRKTTTLLLNFFKTDPGSSRWYLKPGEKALVVPLPK
jgi:hypothetical protein